MPAATSEESAGPASTRTLRSTSSRGRGSETTYTSVRLMASLAVTMGLLMIVAKRGRDASLSREVFNASGGGGAEDNGQ
ncbi:hypothetical protein CGCSCA4_v007982 [Colletotrichum siamense]|uniref:Uncharacterized protein n=1 Tax=Colletotrichum siamense TaxID=690259 RepID=A0A9P5F0Q1_COLSI|nr:hypothetical protein CGCSCA4_v007982 [Colletotrichum siamense]KAF4863438.1 hypothetical protein CGCSCA2_v002860 [Colletotrichum siamense]